MEEKDADQDRRAQAASLRKNKCEDQTTDQHGHPDNRDGELAHGTGEDAGVLEIGDKPASNTDLGTLLSEQE